MKFSTLIILLVGFAYSDAAMQNPVKIIPAVLGSSVSLPCTIPKAGGLLWDHYVHLNQTIIAYDEKITLSNSINQTKFFIQVTGNLQSLIIQSLTLQDDGTYRCADVQSVNIKESFKVNILVRPTRIELLPIPTAGIDEGSVQTLTCEADGGKPPPIFEWYIEGPYYNKTKLPSAESDSFYNNGTGFRRSQLPLKIDRSFYKAKIICLTEITYFFIVQNNMSLDVNLFPGVPSFRNFDGVFNDGQTKTVTCETKGSRPAANITWFINNVPQLNADTRTYKDPDDTYFVSSSLTKRFDKSMDGVNLTCKAMNMVLQRQNRLPVQKTVILRAAYMPVIHALNGSVDVYEHRQFTLHCDVDARPMSTRNEVFWLKNGVIIVEDNRVMANYSKANGKYELSIHEVNRFDIGQYQCQASNPLGIARSSPPLALNVLYRPVCLTSSIEKIAASVGQTVTLTCRVTSNPTNVTITWRYKTRQSLIQEKQPTFTDPGVDKIASSSIQISIRLDIDYTDVECIATNSMGTMIQPCLYMIVKPGPPEIPKSCNITLQETNRFDIRCAPGFNGGGKQHFILQRVEGATFLSINTNDVEPVFNVSDLLPGQNYTYRVCSTSITYKGTVSCGFSLSLRTPDDTGGPFKDPVAAASPQDTTLYIVGGCIGFVFLVLLTVIVVMCIIKRRQQSADNVENVYVDVSDHARDPHHYHIGNDNEGKHENILPSKLEEEDHHHHHHSHHHHSHQADATKKDSHTYDIDLSEMTGPATEVKLNDIANKKSRNTFVRKGAHRYDNTQFYKHVEPDVEDIYAVSTKHRNYRDRTQRNQNFVSEKSIQLTTSRLTLSSTSSKDGLCYSESDIQKALSMSSDGKNLSNDTKSLRRSSSLGHIEYNLPEIEGKTPDLSKKPHETEEQQNDTITPENTNEDTDAFVYIFQDSDEANEAENFTDNIFVDSEKPIYNVEENEDDEAKLKRRRSYHMAIKTDRRSSKDLSRKAKRENEVNDSFETIVGVERSSNDSSTSNNVKPNVDTKKSDRRKYERGSNTINLDLNQEQFESKNTNESLNNINNNFNNSDDLKTYTSKEVIGVESDHTQNVVAYF